MDAAQALDNGRDAVFTLLKVGLPVMAIALVVGLAISLVQALTQIQEQTLSFVPKIVVLFLALIVLMPFMLSTMITYTQGLFDQMIALGMAG